MELATWGLSEGRKGEEYQQLQHRQVVQSTGEIPLLG